MCPKAGSYKLNLQLRHPRHGRERDDNAQRQARVPADEHEELRARRRRRLGQGLGHHVRQVELTKGVNEIKLSCEQGNQCNVNLDQFWLVAS